MRYMENLGVYVNSIEDMENLAYRGMVDGDTVEAMSELYSKEMVEVKEIMEHYKYEKEAYELRLDEATQIANEGLTSIRELIFYIKNSKRINREKILSYLLSLESNIEDVVDC